ncbi:uncharacterized protein YacL [Paenibacillus phyllosphaerae]|uniref:Uncharacterized protein YacL n=1 Tax=Paenibacillus phyllosphaerae TaxID=274593 RepID=A0A7W5AY18_9BACL|nr:hypothetical protein [Paenibacillus phyllosphaerae]MBB3110868.1 uncharacterized protein YacL [Paenibacillus phyllosphaerae]
MENIHFGNMIKSFFLGLFLGIILQVYDPSDALFEDKVMAVLASGSIGFMVGLLTEWLTSVLPIRLANARMYFFINNLIALAVTTMIMGALILISGSRAGDKGEFVSALIIVLSIICIANLFDYLMYRRAQLKLKRFQASLEANSYTD